jgi:hypothetical protein
MKTLPLSELVAELEKISDPNKNDISIHRDRVGNWRVVINEHVGPRYVSERHQVMEIAIDRAITEYQKST